MSPIKYPKTKTYYRSKQNATVNAELARTIHV